MAVQIQSGSNSAGRANVNDDYELNVALNPDDAKAGFAAIAGEANPASDPAGVRTVRPLEVSADFRARVGIDACIFSQAFTESSGQPANLYYLTGTWSVASAGQGRLRLLSTAAAGWLLVRTYMTFGAPIGGTVYREYHVRYDTPPVNATYAFGYSETPNGAGGTGIDNVLTDGAGFEITNSGIRGFAKYNGNTIVTTAWHNDTSSTKKKFLIVTSPNRLEFWVDDKLIGILDNGLNNHGSGLHVGRNYCNFAYFTSNTATIAANVEFGLIEWSVWIGDAGSVYSLNVHNALSNLTTADRPDMTGAAFHFWNNSLNPTAATLSNTGPSYTTPGRFLFNAPAGALTDYSLIAYQPFGAHAVGVNNRVLMVKGVRIHALNIGAAVATTPTTLEWAIAVNTTNGSLTTSDGNTSRLGRRIPLGVQTFPVGAAIGAVAETINVQFGQEHAVAPGNVLVVLMRVPVGTATASQQIVGAVAIDGYYI